MGMFIKVSALALAVTGPLKGIEYWAPLLPYQVALTIGFWVNPPLSLMLADENFSLLE